MGNPARLRASVTGIVRYGEGVYRVTLRPESKVPRFKPGQFTHLTLDDVDPTSGFWPESRVFSIASNPADPVVEIVYSVKGRYTSRMENELTVGRSVWLKLPYGSFIIEHLASDKPVVLIAGGTGITPFIGFVSELVRHNQEWSPRPVVLHYGVRSADMIIHRELLQTASEVLESFQWDLWTEERSPNFLSGGVKAVHAGSILDPRLIVREDGGPETAYFISGPPAMIKNCRETIGECGIGRARIIVDEWE